MPYGHHDIRGLSIISERIGCDLFGLDGSLEIACSPNVHMGSKPVKEAFIGKLMPMLEQHYNFPSKEVSEAEFWDAHPILNRENKEKTA